LVCNINGIMPCLMMNVWIMTFSASPNYLDLLDGKLKNSRFAGFRLQIFTKFGKENRPRGPALFIALLRRVY